MGAIKDIVDLTKDLESRSKDRRDMEIIHKIQSLSLSFQSENADIVERDLKLMQENAELKRQLAESQAEEIRIHRSIEFRRGKRTAGKWTAFCPKCHMPASYNEGTIWVTCSDQSCKWTARLPDMRLSQVIKELDA